MHNLPAGSMFSLVMGGHSGNKGCHPRKVSRNWKPGNGFRHGLPTGRRRGYPRQDRAHAGRVLCKPQLPGVSTGSPFTPAAGATILPIYRAESRVTERTANLLKVLQLTGRPGRAWTLMDACPIVHAVNHWFSGLLYWELRQRIRYDSIRE